jgi:uncharacterized protein
MILTYIEAKKLLLGINKISLDFGKTESFVIIKNANYFFPDNQILTKEDLKKVIKKNNMCFFIENNTIVPISIFSEDTNKYYKLVPTKDWPTLEISGIRMHVTSKITPKEDTKKKISFVSPITGNVLDTCTGLGYTSIMAAKDADLVYTYEKDFNVIEIQKINPHSKELFDDPKIKTHNSDVFEEIKKLKKEFFDVILHDPPRLSLATLLYSQELYNELFRVMKKQGRLYHYTGDPGSRNRNLDIREGISKRLSKSGFVNIKRVFNGLIAEK